MTSDGDLLHAYVEWQSEHAFSALVERHVNMVYSTALRLVTDPHRAEDIVQSVFIILARDAAKIRNPNALSGWLFRTTRFTAARLARAEMRRRQRELSAVHAELGNEEPGPADWPQIAEHIDAAIASLNETDQDALALRFFENKTAREIAGVLGVSEEAAQKRIARALEKVREYLQRRGLATSSTALAAGLAANAAQAAPASSVSAATALTVSTLTLGPFALFVMSAKSKIAIGCLLAVAVITTTVVLKSRDKKVPVAEAPNGAATLPVSGASSEKAAPPAVKSLDAVIAELQKLVGQPNFARRHAAIVDLAAAVSEQDIPAAIARADRFSNARVKTPFIHLLLARLAGSNPTAALASAQ